TSAVRTAASRLTIHAGMAKAIIGSTLIRIVENFVGFLGFLEFLFRLGVIRIAIRVILHRQATISFFQRICVGLAAHAEDFVIIALGHGVSHFLFAYRHDAGTGPAS